MQRIVGSIALLGLMSTMLVSCDSGPKLAKAGGTITYRGKPVPGANVVFIPESGVPAFATTDDGGAFTWTTQGRPGAMVGSGKVAITATEKYEFQSEEKLTTKEIQKMGRSLIPIKYGRAESSGLTATVNEDGNNSFLFELTD